MTYGYFTADISTDAAYARPTDLRKSALRAFTGENFPSAPADAFPISAPPKNGHSLETLSPQQLATTVSFVTTERVRIPNLRCEDVVALGRAPYTNWIGRVQEQDKAIVERSLELVGMAAFAGKTMDRMSDGECQRVMIARALAQDTPIILLDEPTSFLDLPNRYELCTLLRRLAHDHRKCILFSTHELDIALSLCDSIALIDPPVLRYLPTPDMACSGYIERLFSNSFVTFDTESGTIKVRK